MDNPADLINAAIEELVKNRYELPSFATLDRLVSHIRTRVNQRHISLKGLNSALFDIINRYQVLNLPKLWGDGTSAAADGTKYDLYEQNLFSEYHIGINLMPRIRNWKELTFFRPNKETVYQHIDALFSDSIDWELIRTHWQDLFRVVLSIQAGKITSDMIYGCVATASA